jgi:enoyl-CoA hydratase/carnithine racemase
VPEVLVERRDRVTLITLTRPEALNALLGDMRAALRDAFESAGRDPGVGAIVLTGAGRGFCTGGDVKFMGEVMARGGGSRNSSRWSPRSPWPRSSDRFARR